MEDHREDSEWCKGAPLAWSVPLVFAYSLATNEFVPVKLGFELAASLWVDVVAWCILEPFVARIMATALVVQVQSVPQSIVIIVLAQAALSWPHPIVVRLGPGQQSGEWLLEFFLVLV